MQVIDTQQKKTKKNVANLSKLWYNRNIDKPLISNKGVKMNTYKVSYTYVVKTIKTGEIEIEADSEEEARQQVRDNEREFDLYDSSWVLDKETQFEIDDVDEV